jgi:hypothetical protein
MGDIKAGLVGQLNEINRLKIFCEKLLNIKSEEIQDVITEKIKMPETP